MRSTSMIGRASAGARPIPRGGPWPPAADPAGLNGDAGENVRCSHEHAWARRPLLGVDVDLFYF
jgi:hypothetical protein